MSKWISVEDRLPEKGRRVLAAVKQVNYYDDTGCVEEYVIREASMIVMPPYKRKLSWVFWFDKDVGTQGVRGEVTHWKALPRPPALRKRIGGEAKCRPGCRSGTSPAPWAIAAAPSGLQQLLVCWTPHRRFGFGKTRLLRFLDANADDATALGQMQHGYAENRTWQDELWDWGERMGLNDVLRGGDAK